MFDVGFSELIVIGIVALVVIGPERLPRVARTVGHLLGRARRYVDDVKADINREIQLEELKKLQEQMAESMRAVEQNVRQEVDSARLAVEKPAGEADAAASHSASAPAEHVEALTPTVATYGLADQIAAAHEDKPVETAAAAPAPQAGKTSA